MFDRVALFDYPTDSQGPTRISTGGIIFICASGHGAFCGTIHDANHGANHGAIHSVNHSAACGTVLVKFLLLAPYTFELPYMVPLAVPFMFVVLVIVLLVVLVMVPLMAIYDIHDDAIFRCYLSNQSLMVFFPSAGHWLG